MKHRAARARLAELLDGSLPAAEEAAVRSHAEGCATCARVLREYRLAEGLLRRLPARLVPLGGGLAAETRLRVLARWSPRAGAVGGGWLRSPAFPAFGVLAAAAAFAAVLWVTPLAPDLAARRPSAFHSRIVVAATMPSSFLVPSVEAQVAVPYRWRQ